MPPKRAIDTAGQIEREPEPAYDSRVIRRGPTTRQSPVEELPQASDGEPEPPATSRELSEVARLTRELATVDEIQAGLRDRLHEAMRAAKKAEHTQAEIADAASITRQRVGKILEEPKA